MLEASYRADGHQPLAGDRFGLESGLAEHEAFEELQTRQVPRGVIDDERAVLQVQGRQSTASSELFDRIPFDVGVCQVEQSQAGEGRQRRQCGPLDWRPRQTERLESDQRSQLGHAGVPDPGSREIQLTQMFQFLQCRDRVIRNPAAREFQDIEVTKSFQWSEL